MRFALLLTLLLQVGCATKYIIPGNRFITPESQGGVFRGQFEIQKASANQLSAVADESGVDNGVEIDVVDRTGFLASTSFLEPVDVIWSHTGGGNSLLGIKYQIMGASRSAKGTGEKFAITAAFGGNEHEVEGENGIEFELTAKEYTALYGYRFSEMLLSYPSMSYAKYSFSGEINSSDSVIDGLKPKYDTRSIGLNLGGEVDLGNFFGKLECSYQKLKTTDTKEIAQFIFGYSAGYSW